MTTDQQVRRLRMLIKTQRTRATAAAKAGMDVKTARKYLKDGRLPSQCRQEHTWRTRPDPFTDVWEEVKERLVVNPGLEAKTLFEALQREHPGRFYDGQLRSLQRRIKVWRASEGPPQEVFFPQQHYPGQLCSSDFTNMNELGVTIAGQAFEHLIYHFVLTYSNWETGSICFSESYESLSEGLQNALWELGGVPQRHRTDRLSAAVHKDCNPEEFTIRYWDLLKHYGLSAEKTQADHAHENGDIEQRHYRFKNALDQVLQLRGRRDFVDRQEYDAFLQKLFIQLNSGRKQRLAEELKLLRGLPERRLDDCKKEWVKVGPSSTIRVRHNTYSVHSRLIGEWVEARIYAQRIEIWYAQRKVETLPRIRGENKHRIHYRHIIDWLVRKPGAFENYRYRDDLFPSSHFRMVYDYLRANHSPPVAGRQYLKLLYLAATESEALVEGILQELLELCEPIAYETVRDRLSSERTLGGLKDIPIIPVDLVAYDALLNGVREEAAHG
jgi:hypothetical protein